jgi:hypothetical protein
MYSLLYIYQYSSYLIPAFILLKMFPFRQIMMIARIQIGYHIREVCVSTNILFIMVLHHLLKYAPIYVNYLPSTPLTLNGKHYKNALIL